MPVKADKTGQPLLDRVLEAICTLVNRLERILIPRDKPVTVVFAAANTDTLVPHGLGHPVAGYVVTSLTAAAIVYSGSAVAAPQSPNVSINLKASATCTATVVFW